MRAEVYAILTACCWGVGSLLEKKGVKLGNLTPVMGPTIRTAFSVLLLLAVSFPYWAEVKTAGPKSLSLIAVGGGILAGGLGLIFLYTGLKHGNIATVMAVAFCLAPVVGSILGYLVLRERLSLVQVGGIALCIVGAAITTLFRQT